MVTRLIQAEQRARAKARRCLGITLVAMLAGVSVGVSVASPVFAATGTEGCNPGRGGDGVTRWDGGDRNYAGIGGVWASIRVYSPWVVNWASGWSMLFLSGSSVEHHAQAGWDEYQYSNRFYFAEWTYNNNGSWFRDDRTPPSSWVDTTHKFTVLYNNYAPGVFSLQLDGSTFDHTASDFVPNNGQVFGETHSAADQMPGGTQNPEDFNSEEVWVPVSNWIWADLYPLDSNTNWYNIAKYNSAHFQIGDKACVH